MIRDEYLMKSTYWLAGFRFILAVLYYLWLHLNTPFHKIVPWRGTEFYGNIEHIFHIAVFAYLVLYAFLFILQAILPRDGRINKDRRLVVETFALLLFVLDTFVLYSLQYATGGPESPFGYGNYILIVLFALCIRSYLANAVFLAMHIASYIVQCLDYAPLAESARLDMKPDILIESVALLGFWVALMQMRRFAAYRV